METGAGNVYGIPWLRAVGRCPLPAEIAREKGTFQRRFTVSEGEIMCDIFFDEYGACFRPCLDNLRILGGVHDMLQATIMPSIAEIRQAEVEAEMLIAKSERIAVRSDTLRGDRWTATRKRNIRKALDATELAVSLSTEAASRALRDFWLGHDVECADYCRGGISDAGRYAPQQMTDGEIEVAINLAFRQKIASAEEQRKEIL